MLALVLALQATVHAVVPSPPAASTSRPTAPASYARIPPVIDGRDDDAVWSEAALLDSFPESVPAENLHPRFRTTGRIAYDARNLYVFLRAYDPHPDSIVTQLARRDGDTRSDYLGVLIDGYRDRRSGFEFDVNPSGVKSDFAFRNDGEQFDAAWDGVWDVATRIDSLGWTAEFRIPLSQIRYPAATRASFGIYLWRLVKRTGEGLSWPLRHRSLPGLASQFGDVMGLDGLAAPRRGELVPYVVAEHRSVVSTAVGADFKYALAPNVVLNATVNPDFGQVEADPAELNLTVYETFFPERRPFFVAGAGQFTYDLNCGLYSCFREGLFYSRRIGRDGARILGAAKLTGQSRALSLAGLVAATARGTEPAARYGVLRATRAFRQGETDVGVRATGMIRDLDPVSATTLHRDAYAAGFDFRHRFRRQYTIHGSVDWSRVDGTPAAITLTQREPIHNYQRPDGALTLDTARTRLTGDDEQLAFDKLGGVFRFQGVYTRRSPGFEVNDVGYLRQADLQTAYGWVNLTLEKPTRLYRRFVWNLNAWWWATTAGLVTDRAVNTNAHLTLNSLWTLGAWIAVNGLGTTFCDGCARGGPALRQDRGVATWFDVTGDDRHRLVPEVTVTTSSADAGRSSAYSVTPSLRVSAATRFAASLGMAWTATHDDRQWLANVTDSTGRIHYTFAHLDRRSLGVTLRANYTMSPALSLQLYAQPFASWGPYSDVRELADARAAHYADRFESYSGTPSPAGVDSRQFNGNIVLRWEYLPGSTIFAVWTQGRQEFDSTPGTGSGMEHLHDVFSHPAANTFLIKVSHWLNW